MYAYYSSPSLRLASISPSSSSPPITHGSSSSSSSLLSVFHSDHNTWLFGKSFPPCHTDSTDSFDHLTFRIIQRVHIARNADRCNSYGPLSVCPSVRHIPVFCRVLKTNEDTILRFSATKSRLNLTHHANKSSR